jgi:hypothetical protein
MTHWSESGPRRDNGSDRSLPSRNPWSRRITPIILTRPERDCTLGSATRKNLCPAVPMRRRLVATTALLLAGIASSLVID